MQALTYALHGKVAPSGEREYGPAQVETVLDNPLLPPGSQPVWMSHGDRIETPPPGFVVLARSSNSPVAAMGDLGRRRFGVQFHPEVHHTPAGKAILRRFVVEICQARPDWTPESIIQQAVERIRRQVGSERLLAAVSGGVDLSVAAALVYKAVGSQLAAVFVDNGLLRQGERQQVEAAFQERLGGVLKVAYATSVFLQALQGVSEPETKRRIIGETFIRTLRRGSAPAGPAPCLWSRARFIRTWLNPACPIAIRPNGSRNSPQRRRAAHRHDLRTGRTAALSISRVGARRG